MQSNTFLGLIVGENIITLKRVSSTNDYIKEHLSNSAPFQEGTVIMAEDQYAGRGQSGNTWISEPGKNLTFSLLLSPSFLPPPQQFELNIAISIGVSNVLSPLLKEKLTIKWPNDLYIGNKKLGGLLIENIFRGKHWKHAIIGIGINVNQTRFGENSKACSMKSELQHDFDRQELLHRLCKSISTQYDLLKKGGQQQQKTGYLEKLYRIQQPADFIVRGNQMSGKIVNVNNIGQLEVDFDGTVEAFNSKEISFVI